MKNLMIIISLLSLISCNNNKRIDYTLITGSIQNNTADSVFISGNNFEARIHISPAGAFGDTLQINTDGLYEMYVGRERTEIYLEKGKKIAVALNADQFDESLEYTGDLSNENNFLVAKYLWQEKNMDFKELFSMEEEDFLNQLSDRDKGVDSLYKVHNIINENFHKYFEKEDRFAQALIFENYKDAHRYYSGIKDFTVSDTFYNAGKNIDYADTLAYRNSVTYRELLNAHFSRLVSDNINEDEESNPTILFLKKVNESLPAGFAKDKIMYGHMKMNLKPDNSLDEAFSIYKNSNPNRENLADITDHYTNLGAITKGKPSPTFNFENHKGGNTSLAELKGKYVYIDVWATWCGPCLREIPSLKVMEADYANKNLEFVSISIDEKKDYEKWKSMVTEKELGGIQLFADNNWDSEFVEQYVINGIPRFILLDSQGNIVSADAPRPSDPELRKILDGLNL